nr:TIGR04139 family peptide modification target [uncultured Chryseobacterium sp.]
MKKLIGIKNGVSSIENKKLKRQDLKSIQGNGNSYVSTDCGSECYDKETWKDGKLQSTLYIN